MPARSFPTQSYRNSGSSEVCNRTILRIVAGVRGAKGRHLDTSAARIAIAVEVKLPDACGQIAAELRNLERLIKARRDDDVSCPYLLATIDRDNIVARGGVARDGDNARGRELAAVALSRPDASRLPAST
jgi:hypothetical protein